MLNINRPYFAEVGITATSANHLCNVAKERYEYLESKLETLSFLNESISIIGTNEVIPSKVATMRPDEVPSILEEIAHLKGFIAIMRTAIKEKESLDLQLQSYHSDEYSTFHRDLPPEPHMPKKVTIEDLQKHLTPSEFNRYLILEAKAATIGKVIHPSGEYSNARKNAFNKISQPTEVSENGRDTIIRTYSLNTNKQDIDSTFFALQKTHRELEAEMNGLKTKVENVLKSEYRMKKDAYNLAVRESDTKVHELLEASNKERDELIQKLRSFKIVVPPQYTELVKQLS